MLGRRSVRILVAVFLAGWLGLGVFGYSVRIRNASTYDAMADIWSDGPGRSPLTVEEARVKELDYRIKAHAARHVAHLQLGNDLLFVTVLFLMWELLRLRTANAALNRITSIPE